MSVLNRDSTMALLGRNYDCNTGEPFVSNSSSKTSLGKWISYTPTIIAKRNMAIDPLPSRSFWRSCTDENGREFIQMVGMFLSLDLAVAADSTCDWDIDLPKGTLDDTQPQMGHYAGMSNASGNLNTFCWDGSVYWDPFATDHNGKDRIRFFGKAESGGADCRCVWNFMYYPSI